MKEATVIRDHLDDRQVMTDAGTTITVDRERYEDLRRKKLIRDDGDYVDEASAAATQSLTGELGVTQAALAAALHDRDEAQRALHQRDADHASALNAMVNERDEARNQLAQANADWENQVNALTGQLAESRAQLVEQKAAAAPANKKAREPVNKGAATPEPQA